MGPSSTPPPASGPGEAGGGAEGPDLPVYQITLVPGPDILRRGINPLGVLDELRELGEATITTNADLVPPLDLIDPERCYLTWTITLKTGAEPDRIDDAFLFFAEDSIVTIERWTPDGKLVPVRPAESKAAATETVNGPEYRRPRVRNPSIPRSVIPWLRPRPDRLRRSTETEPPRLTPRHRFRSPPSPSHRARRPAHPVIPRPHARIRVDAGAA